MKKQLVGASQTFKSLGITCLSSQRLLSDSLGEQSDGLNARLSTSPSCILTTSATTSPLTAAVRWRCGINSAIYAFKSEVRKGLILLASYDFADDVDLFRVTFKLGMKTFLFAAAAADPPREEAPRDKSRGTLKPWSR